MENILRIMISLCLLVIVSGCEFIGNLGVSDEDRINKAIPLSADVIASKLAFDTLAKSLQADTSKFNDEYGALLKLRALECGRGYNVAITASDESIRNAISDTNCFSQADDKLLNWLGERRIGLLLSAPPLRPVPKAAPSILTASEFIVGVEFADRAGIALIQLRKKYQILDMVSNEIIHTADTNGERPTSISPNGRLFVIDNKDFTEVHESETGILLAKYPEVHAWEFFWINDVGALYTPSQSVSNSNGSRDTVFIDFSSGKKSRIPLNGATIMRTIRLPSQDIKFVALTWTTTAVLKLIKSETSWVLKLDSLTDNPSSNSWLISSQFNFAIDKLYGSRESDLYQLSLKSLKLDNTSLYPLSIHTILHTPYPDKLYIKGFLKETPGSNLDHYIYSIRNQTLSFVLNADAHSFRPIFIPSLNANAFINNANIVLLKEFSTNGPQPANILLQDLQKALFSAAQQRSITQAYMNESAEMQRAKAIVRMQNEDGISSAMLDTIMKQHNISASTITAARRSILAESTKSTPASITTSSALIKNISANTTIEAIGVYEGTSVEKNTPSRTGTVHVRVVSGNRPIILSLSSYESVKWIVSLEPGAKLSAVLLSGYNSSEVFGIGNTPQYVIGRASPYEKTDTSYTILKNEIMNWTGKPIMTFQGLYTGKSFSVGY